MKQWVRQHRGLTIAAGLAAVVGAVFILIWFQPQSLFIDDVVDETIPSASPTTQPPASQVDPTTTTSAPDATTSDPAPDVEPPTFPLTLTSGEFIDLAHSGTGTALIIELEDGSRILRFEDLDIDNGPDLRVILSTSPLVDDDSAYDDGDFLDLGVLKGNIGNQNYDIPNDVDIDDYATVAIWCRRFNVTFNAAPITWLTTPTPEVDPGTAMRP